MPPLVQCRAAGLAVPLGPAIGRATTVARALSLLERCADLPVVVVGRASPFGGLTRRELQRARGVGLARVRVSRLLVADLREVAPNATLPRVLDALSASPSPFVLVRSATAGPASFIDRRTLASQLRESGTWRPCPWIDEPTSEKRAGPALRGLLSAVAVSALQELGRRAHRCGVRACLVGGVVRDLLLNRETKDLDVAVEGELRDLIRGLGSKRTIHARFQTATVTLKDGTKLDLARARTERYATPACLPVVSPAPIEEDLGRRDFTINTLAFSLDPRRFGRVLDLHGGVEDLRNRIIRVLHGLSFIDDPTRGFRAVRLAARLGFGIEPRTASQLRFALGRGSLGSLSSTRLRREVEALFSAPEFPTALRLAARYGLLAALHPRLALSPRTRAAMNRASREIAWYENQSGREPFQRWLIPLGLLLDAAEPEAARKLIEWLAPRRRESKVLERSRAGVAALFDGLARRSKPAPSETHALCREHDVETLLMALAAAPREGVRRLIRRHLGSERATKADIDGRDLLRAGVEPGPDVAIGLDAALCAKLDGVAETREEQLRRALEAAGVSPGAA